MKKLPVLFFCVIACMITAFSCDFADNDVSFSVSESEHSYSMTTHFSKSKTRVVDEYMDSKIRKRGKMSFVNSRIDGTIAIDNRTAFYIKKYPGFLEIELDKDKNSNEAYHRVKSMCEGIKKIITK